MQWFRPAGRVPFGSRPDGRPRQKEPKGLAPPSGPCASLRVRSLHRRSRGPARRAIPGPSRLSRHPCRSTPSTTIPLTLLKGRGVACGCGVASVGCYSPEGQYTVPVWWAACGETTLRKRVLLTPFGRAALGRTIKQLGARVPVSRPSGGVAQGDEPHGCGERLEGPWMALASRPPERHRREGSRAQRDPDVACPSLWLLSLGQARESDSP